MPTATITVTAADQISQKQVVDRWTARHAREIVGKTVRVSRVVRNGPFITYKLAIEHTTPPETRRPTKKVANPKPAPAPTPAPLPRPRTHLGGKARGKYKVHVPNGAKPDAALKASVEGEK